jgi:hypothetical protein
MGGHQLTIVRHDKHPSRPVVLDKIGGRFYGTYRGRSSAEFMKPA